MANSTSSQDLQYLIESIPKSVIDTSLDCKFSGISFDSRKVNPGDLYFAIKGETFDGHNFIGDAVDNGASGVVGTKQVAGLHIPYIQVQNSRLALAYLSAAFYGFPSKKMVIVGVTGTDGKTTTASLIYQIFIRAGIKVGLLSTVNAFIGDEVINTGFHVTTPDAVTIQSILSKMVNKGLTHAVLEVTSHGLSQERVSAIDFNVGVITNITHEHLDYHGSFEGYKEAKGLLFKHLSPKYSEDNLIYGAVLNVDDPSYEYLQSITKAPIYGYGIANKANFRAEAIIDKSDSIQFSVINHLEKVQSGIENKLTLRCNLPGVYNIYNCLAAVTTTAGVFRLDKYFIEGGIAKLPPIPGRMEALNLGQQFKVYVDFAHTPNALRNALLFVKSIIDAGGSGGRVICVFGSAGLRDREKRVSMTKTAAELADFSIITAEDPRTESLIKILDEMEAGFRFFDKKIEIDYLRIGDRREAIKKAILMAKDDDVVIICGKGHEQSMCFDDVEYEWDDRVAVIAVLSELMGIDGPEMPYLPGEYS